MPIYDKNDNVISNAVQKVLSHPDVVEIKNRTLDGKYHIQTIGTSGTIADVSAYFTPAEKLLFDEIKRRSAPLTVTFDGRYYTGLIDGEPSYDRLPASNAVMFAISFSLLVETEGVIT